MSASGRLEIRAGLAGTIVSVSARVGERCEEGATIAVLEAMKLEIPITAAAAGAILEVAASPGQTVAEDEVIAVIQVESGA